MNKTVKHIVEGFDFGNISNDNPSKNITRNLRRSIDDYINENAYKFLHGDTSIDPEFFDMVACYKPKDRDELDDLVGMADVTYNGNCSLNWIDVSDFKYLNSLFYNSRFIGDISKWDVSNCEEMSSMFARSSFNGNISEWETGSCKNMSEMFQDSEFNGDISKWDVSNVRNMDGMFSRSKFNNDISNWDVSNVESMNNMFEYSKFNGDLSKWDVHNVKEMMGIFDDAAFTGDISDWDIYDNLEQGKASIIEHIQWYYGVHKQDKPRLL
jgi:surface protein